MNNLEYWQKREDEALKHRITDEIEYRERIEEIYSNMLDSTEKEINAFYGKYASRENITLAEAKARVSSLDIKAYERKAERYVKDREFSTQANEEMRLYNATMRINRLEMLKANIGLELIAGHEELNKFMGDILKGRTEDELKRQAGILGKTIKNNAQTAEAIVNSSFHNATFSDRIWLYQDLLKSNLDKLLQQGLISGKSPKALARELKNTFDVSIENAERLMITELARVQTEAQKQSFERNGFEEYTFLANSGCCGDCQALNGKHFKVKDMMPGENAAPLHPRCRCSTAAYSDRKEYDEWLDFLEKGGTTAEFEKLKARGGKVTAPAPKAAKMSENELKTELEDLRKKLDILDPFSGNTEDFVAFFETAQKIKELESKLKPANTNKTDSTYNKITKVSEAEAKLKAIGVKSVSAKFLKLNDELLIDNVNALTKLEEKFGALKKTSVNLDCTHTTRSTGSVSTVDVDGAIQVFKLSSHYFGKTKQDYVNYRKSAIERGWSSAVSPENYSIYTTVHEYGHIIENNVIGSAFKKLPFERRRELDLDGLKADTWHKSEAARIQREILDIAKEKSGNKDLMSYDYISDYGKTNCKEFFAEAFANSQLGEPNIIGEAMNIWLERNGITK